MISEISIIIPTLNEEKYLPLLLESLLIQNFNGKLQIIIVDGKSEDKTLDVAKSYQNKFEDLVFLRTERGHAYQRNRGAEKAKYKHLLFIDADVILPKKLLTNFTKDIDPLKKIIQTSFTLPIKSNFIDYIFALSAYIFATLYSFFDPFIYGFFILTTKENHNQINGFDEKAVVAEDLDYGHRSVKNGAEYKMHLNTVVYHSSRRFKRMGRFRLFTFYLRGFFYYKIHGVIYDKNRFNYPYGDY